MTEKAIEKGVTLSEQNKGIRPNGTDNHTKGHPTMNYIAFNQIPETLKDFNNWVAWKLIDGKKIPINPDTGEWVSSTATESWTDFATVEKACKSGNYDGIGFMFSNSPVVGVDIDDCIKNGVVCQTAKEIIEGLDSYTELSPSGSGVHILFMGQDVKALKATEKRLQALDITDCKTIEIYSTARYFTITGHLYDNKPNHSVIMPVLGKQEQYFNNLYHRLAPPQIDHHSETVELPTVSDTEALERARKSPNFEKLWNGDTSAYNNDHSSADMALMNILAIATRKNAEQMERLFYQSGLGQRKKAKRADYMQRTINRAIEDTTIMKENIQANHSEKVIPIEEGQKNIPIKWVTVNEYGLPLKEDWRNIKALTDHLGISIRFNMFTRTVDIKVPDQTETLQADTYIADIRALCAEHKYRLSTQDTKAGLYAIADRNRYNPLRDYLNKVYSNWDGKDHIQDVFSRITIDPTSKQYHDLYKTLIKKWLVQCVAMAFNDGETMSQGILIFTGDENIGKTSFVFAISPYPEWAQTNLRLSEWENKDDLLLLAGIWLPEYGEIGDTVAKSRNTNRLKNFITAKVDEYRPPYRADKVRYPRMASLFGTNNDAQFLDSLVGNRRYWVIPIERLDFEHNPIDKNQLWATVMHEWKNGYSFRLTREEQAELESQHLDNVYVTEEEQSLLDSFEWSEQDMTRWTWFNASEINHLLINRCSSVRKLGAVLARSKIFRNGLKLERRRIGSRGYVYLMPPKKITIQGLNNC